MCFKFILGTLNSVLLEAGPHEQQLVLCIYFRNTNNSVESNTEVSVFSCVLLWFNPCQPCTTARLLPPGGTGERIGWVKVRKIVG